MVVRREYNALSNDKKAECPRHRRWFLAMECTVVKKKKRTFESKILKHCCVLVVLYFLFLIVQVF